MCDEYCGGAHNIALGHRGEFGLTPPPNTEGSMSTDENGFDESEEIDEIELVRIHDGEEEVVCAVMAIADIGDQEYALLGRAEQLTDEEGDLELFIFRYNVDEDDIENFSSVESDDEYNKAREFFNTLMAESEE